MHSLETIKKLSGEYPEETISKDIMIELEFPRKSIIEIITSLKEKADKWDAHVLELRSEPLRKNQ